MSWTTIWLIFYVLIIISTVIVILLENRNPLKALSWIIIILLLPLFGLIVYFFVGKDTRQLRIISKKTYERINKPAVQKAPIVSVTELPFLGHHNLLFDLIHQQTGSSVMQASEIAVFTDGLSKFESFLADIKRAKKFIHLQYFKIFDDRTGVMLAESLIEKAKEGVAIRVIYDHVGSFNTANRFWKELRRHGIEAEPILTVAFPELTSKVNYRNHRKVAVIDGHVGYIGGMNVADHYTFGNYLGQWRDTHFRVTGMAVNGLQAAFMTDWYVATRKILPKTMYIGLESLDQLNRLEDEIIPNSSEAYQRAPKCRGAFMQTFSSGPTGHFRTLLQALCRSIYEARKSIKIHTPYFLPNESLNKAIIGAALSGVKVEILIPWVSDSFTVKYAAQSYYAELIEAGVDVYRYDGGFLHSKLITIDDEISFIGSANLDFRSLEHNFEITSVVYDKAFTVMLGEIMQRDFDENGTLLNAEEWSKRPVWNRLLESTLRLFSPLL
ncbi:cardiolipin synthase [Porphyromonadaceae bacterium W3.11]|nr:cardiolipin synthase [Porphyromonadaceae bacterium W3.11]